LIFAAGLFGWLAGEGRAGDQAPIVGI